MITRVALVIVLVLLAAALAAEAQPTGKIPRIGVIGELSPTDPFLAAFQQGLRELGYREGENIVVEYRYANGVSERFADLAAELLRLKIDVLVVGGATAARAAQAQTKTVPIVFVLPGDPVGSGLVASLSHPGGNATGTSTLIPELAARALAVELHVIPIRKPKELESAFAAARAQRADALMALADPVFGIKLAQLADLAARHHLPAIYVRAPSPRTSRSNSRRRSSSSSISRPRRRSG